MTDEVEHHDPLSAMVKEEPNCFHCDLHAHLLGCGDHRFWVDNIMHSYLPKRYGFFKGSIALVKRFPPLLFFNKSTGKFFSHDEAVKFLENAKDFRDPNTGILEKIHAALEKLKGPAPGAADGQEHADFFGFFQDLFDESETLEQFVGYFKDAIEYDVVYSVKNLALGLCLDGEDNEIRKSHICEMLECRLEDFKTALIFNARKQQFQRVEGITNAQLINICKSKMALQCVRNAFSMLSQEGGFAGAYDFASYRGHFTPQFYPGRFALKDSIYEQRPDVLMRLLEHIDSRCQKSTCSNGDNNAWKVQYMELSIGAGDASKRHMMAFLTDKVMEQTELGKALHEDIKSTLFGKTGRTEFKYLAGFNRGKVDLPLGPPSLFDATLPQIIPKSSTVETPPDSQKCWKLMKTYPHRCINLFNESLDDGVFCGNFKGMFKGMHEDLSKFKATWNSEEEQRASSIVGFDLFGDELGTPYSPFASSSFRDFLESSKFGCRVHFGEGIPAVGNMTASFVAWIVHMFIGLTGIYKTCEIAHTRVGHGVAIARLLSLSESKEWRPFTQVLYRHCLLASSVIINCVPENRKVALEVNLTSNRYLLPEHDCRDDVLALKDLAKCFLSTDDDGVWPLNGTSETCHHIGLHGEYVMAVNRGMISTVDVMKMLDNAVKAKFMLEDYDSGLPSSGALQVVPPNSHTSMVKWLCRKLIFDPAVNKENKDSDAYGFVKSSCPWIQSADTDNDSVISSDLGCDRYDPSRASTYFQDYVFSANRDPETELFVGMAYRLCRFQEKEPFVMLTDENKTYHVWIIENHPTEVMFQNSHFDNIQKAKFYLYFDRLEALERFVLVVSAKPRVVDVCTVYGAFAKPSKMPSWVEFVSIPPCPLGMSVVPLLYHSALLPVLAAFCFNKNLKLDHPKSLFTLNVFREEQRKAFESSKGEGEETQNQDVIIEQLDEFFTNLKLDEGKNLEHISQLFVTGWFPRSYMQLPNDNYCDNWTIPPLLIDSKLYCATNLKDDNTNTMLLELLLELWLKNTSGVDLVDSLLKIGSKVHDLAGSCKHEMMGPLVKEVWERMVGLDHTRIDAAKLAPGLDKITKGYFGDDLASADELGVFGLICRAVQNTRAYRFGCQWQLVEYAKSDFLTKAIKKAQIPPKQDMVVDDLEDDGQKRSKRQKQ